MTPSQPETPPPPNLILYIDEQSGAPIYQCLDCLAPDDDGIVVGIDAHTAWHYEERVGEIHLSLEKTVCSPPPVPPKTTHVPLSGKDLRWAQRFAAAAEALASVEPHYSDLLKVSQKYVPCSVRGTHSSLDDCWICYSDVLRGDASRDEVLLPLDARHINRDPLAVNNPWDAREPDSGSG